MKFLLTFVVITFVMTAYSAELSFEQLKVKAKQENWSFKLKQYDQTFGKGLIEKDLPAAQWKSFVKEKRMQRAEIPNTLDLRAHTTQIENQGSLGSCWAFSLIANLRDGLALLGHDPGRLSQEYLTQCSGYCNGGYFDASDELLKPKGAPLWDEVPYTASCTPRCKTGTPVASITKWYFLGENKNATTYDIARYMAETGLPVSITVSATGAWDNYDSGIYDACNTRSTNHMINIVGYDLEGQAFDSQGWLPKGKGIWILRNSWGTRWGENGFMRSKITSSGGYRCNNVAQRAVVFEYDVDPNPPPPPPEECGNGIIEGDEQCDDGNLVNGDGCDSQCQIEPTPPPPPSPNIWQRIWNVIVAIFQFLFGWLF